ncbi:hypothetical protein Mp_8g08530 [Marchantia polymorpha subsp. ruderalis]|uniref:MyTH4 domain-containing protein n=1 Tax=Marchantia polymorpha TaxID=3197 RepID=A0A2R6WRN1_MARPO|nr:hypothetical protein MARPO_0063s0065 [Marchantia polymorpha]BBN19186.1 hypothetical protein Mp_8g08530 [Marchantia polymorpha subsp. ruderalis]|eukprot:PTQ36527.1 hypothetical protein MARPO_0063s0065 [Marchantia polymorpha]
MAYMGDVPTKRGRIFHIHQILSAGIKYAGLRDEVFTQIIKQTTSNPSRLSNVKGWQAMALCCGTFRPSEVFYPYLDAYLEQVAGGNISRKGTADTLGMLEQGMVNPAEAAAYCLERLRKVKNIGPRHLLPLSKEIEAVENMDTLPREVSLPDGTWQAFILRPMDTSEEVVTHLVNILGLFEARSYGLYQLDSNGVEKLIGSNSYILEVEASCNTLVSTPQNIQDIRFGAKTILKLSRFFCGSEDDHVEDSLSTVVLGSGSGGQSQFSEGNLHMLLKRKLYLVDLETLPPASRQAVLSFEYAQAVHDIVQGVHIVSEGDAMMLGAMQLRADLGTSRVEPEILAGIDGSKYGPQYCVQGNEGAWKDAIATTLYALPPSDNVMSWKQDYIDYVKSRCPLYEACRFFVRPLSNPAMPREMYLAVASTGVSFVDAKSRESINFLEYAEIASWGYTPTVFSIIVGSMSISTDNQFETTQGLEIANVIQLYVDLIQSIQEKSGQAEPALQEQLWDPLQGV